MPEGTHIPMGGRALTDAALRALGVVPTVLVPLERWPWRDDALDRKPDPEVAS